MMWVPACPSRPTRHSLTVFPKTRQHDQLQPKFQGAVPTCSRQGPRRWGGTVAAKEKLIRDKVPQIIRAQGDEPIVRIADPGEYRELLRAKLVEEAHEVATADDAHVPEELADVLEVVLALAADLGVDAGGLERLRSAKAVERGSFTDRIVWCGNLGS